MDDDARRALLRSRTFRWSSDGDTTGYLAVEVVGERVRYFAWSHVHGEGRRELGEQPREALVREGPLVPMPPTVLAQLLAALG